MRRSTSSRTRGSTASGRAHGARLLERLERARPQRPRALHHVVAAQQQGAHPGGRIAVGGAHAGAPTPAAARMRVSMAARSASEIVRS